MTFTYTVSWWSLLHLVLIISLGWFIYGFFGGIRIGYYQSYNHRLEERAPWWRLKSVGIGICAGLLYGLQWPILMFMLVKGER